MGLSLMPGGRGIFPTLSVDENLRLGTWMIRKDHARRAEAPRRASSTSSRFCASGATSRRATSRAASSRCSSLAMALMVTPKVLMIDELSLGLAPTVVAQLLDVVKLLHDHRHHHRRRGAVGQRRAASWPSGPSSWRRARCASAAAPSTCSDRPDILRSVFIAGAGSVEGTVVDAGRGTDGPATCTPARPRPSIDGRPGQRVPPSAEAPAILECNGVRKTFGGITAIQDISLTLRDGEILGLIGHNGAGKTTFFDCVSGFLALDGGRIRLGGVDIDTWPAHMRAAAGTGTDLPRGPALPVADRGRDDRRGPGAAPALAGHGGGRPAPPGLARLGGRRRSEGSAADRHDGARRLREKLVGELSTGTRRIVELACVLAQEPGVLLLDEPSGGVAQRETEAMGPLLVRVQQHTGCSILVVEHDMPLLTAICDRMIALELGEVIAEGTPAEVLEHPAVIESYLGTDESTINRSGDAV